MKRLLPVLFCSILFCGRISAQCPQFDLTITNQEYIDNFSLYYPGCTEIPVSIRIEEGIQSDITSLSGLSQITAINGSLAIIDSPYLSLTGLDNLTTVGETFRIEYSVSSLAGLESLTSVGGDFVIHDNYGLKDSITALVSLTSVGGNFEMSNNQQIKSLKGLESLTSVGGNLQITNLNDLTDCTGLNPQISIGGDLHIASARSLVGLGTSTIAGDLIIARNAFLSDLVGLENITLGGSLHIDDNNRLISLTGLENLTSINGDLRIESNYDLTTLTGLDNLMDVGGELYISVGAAVLTPLDNLNSVGGDLTIRGTSASDLSALYNLTSIPGNLSIYNNYSLTSLNGLHNITSIDGSLNIHRNNLTNLAELSNLNSINGLSINSSSLTDLTGLESLTSIGGYVSVTENNNLVSLSGLDNVTSIDGYLHFKSNDVLTNLTGLDNLSSIEEYVFIEYSALTDLTGLNNLTSIGGYLKFEFTNTLRDFTGLNKLTSIGGDMLIEINYDLTSFEGLNSLTSVGRNMNITNNNSLVSLAGLDNVTSVGRDLQIGGNDVLSSLTGLSNLTTVSEDVRIYYNDVLTDLTGLNNIDSLIILRVNNNPALINLVGLDSLTTVEEEIDIRSNDNLVSLFGLNRLNKVGELHVKYNTNLNTCSTAGICNYLTNGGSIFVEYNGLGCFDRNTVQKNCLDNTKILSSIFYDINQNKNQDADEPYYSDASVLIEPGSFVIQPNTTIPYYIEPGSYTITTDLADNTDWKFTTDSTSYFINLEQGVCDTIIFGIHPVNQVSDIQSFTISPPTRCNERIPFDITAKNLGNTVADGILWLEIDENISSVTYHDVPDTTITPNRYGWFFNTLYPSHSVEKRIRLNIPGPLDFEIGDSLVFHTYVDFEDLNGSQASSTFTYTPEVRCSYDPNDKLVNPSREGDYALFDEDLIYTVRFQNTGNDVAYNVVIRDTLDTNLDLTSFRVLGSSHTDRLNTSMRENGILNFEFKDIFLPDSTSNFEGSQGYVSYLIRTIDGLAENTPVTNSAGIYFDLNPPVITNTVKSVMVSELPIVSVQSPDNELDFNIIPNPNTGIFHVQGTTNGTYRVFNTMGQVIHSGLVNKDTAIDIPQATSGVYFIEIREEERVGTRRFVKQ